MKKKRTHHSEDANTPPEVINLLGLIEQINSAILFSGQLEKKMAILFVNLDNFKKINMGYDYFVGDQILDAVRERLQKIVRQSDYVLRLAGDESAVILMNLDSKKEGIKLARSLLKKIAAVYEVDRQLFYISASIGMSVYPDHGVDPMVLMKSADMALYQAKKLGGDQFQCIHLNKNYLTNEQIKLENALHHALKHNEFFLVYQPILNLKTKTFVRMEVLLRWRRPDGKIVLPEEFLPFAEVCNLMTAIGKFVIDNAFLQIRQIKKAGLPVLGLAINFSARQLNTVLVNYLSKKIKENEIDPTTLTLELTEKNILQSTPKTDLLFNKLHGLGIQLSIDDFGMEYSSIRYLKVFAVDNIKLDKLFVSELPNNPYSVAIVSAMLAMGKALGLSVTAEGIENQAQLDFLQRHGCDEGQGFYLKKPLSERTLLSFLRELQHLKQ